MQRKEPYMFSHRYQDTRYAPHTMGPVQGSSWTQNTPISAQTFAAMPRSPPPHVMLTSPSGPQSCQHLHARLPPPIVLQGCSRIPSTSRTCCQHPHNTAKRIRLCSLGADIPEEGWGRAGSPSSQMRGTCGLCCHLGHVPLSIPLCEGKDIPT